MERFWDLRRTHKKAWYGAWSLVLVAVVGGAQWRFDVTAPIRTQVLGAQAKKPDVTPPTVSVSFPAKNGQYSVAAWASGCTPLGVCGSASDSSGIAVVQLAFTASNGRYWDPNTGGFTATSAAWLTANGTTTWNLPWARPADGSYTVFVRATDSATPASNTSVPMAVPFVVDTGAPQAPTITAQPDNPTFDTAPRFAYRDAEAGVSFECRLDSAPAQACGSSTNYKNIAAGDHSFSVVAIDGAGNRSPAAPYAWTIVENKSFNISGSVSQQLFPGVTRPLDLVLGNPYNFSITVTSVTVTVDPQTTKATGGANTDCVGTTNLEVSQQLATAVTLQAKATSSLSQLGVVESQWPQLHMPNLLLVNQDGCKNTTFKLSYTGTAQKS